MNNTIQQDLASYATSQRKRTNERFFKTGKGEYSEHDRFLGVALPDIRRVVKQHRQASRQALEKLLKSPLHEERLCGLLILVQQYQKTDDTNDKQAIFNYYVKNLKHVNNWDLVDVTVPKIIGAHLLHREKKLLYTLAKSSNLWKRRTAILATYTFIQHNKFQDTIKLAELLLGDSHDLMHKATGWMLREVGKRDQAVLEQFLDKHGKRMPRTALRYAIERFPEQKRKQYLISSKA